jgi:hypothetical protein
MTMAHIDTSALIRGSLWIRPTGEALHKIDQAVRVAHDRVGGPRVKPHVSLVNGIETTDQQAEDRLRKLSLRVAPFPVRLGKIGWRHEYYRALFVEVELSDELIAAHRIAHELFEMNPGEPFEPHVSLVYGDLHEPLQQELADEIGGRLDGSFMATIVQLSNASGDRPIPEWRAIHEQTLGAR